MRLGTKFFVMVFFISLCSFSPCFGRKGRHSLAPEPATGPSQSCHRKKSPPPGHKPNPPSEQDFDQLVFNVDDFGAKADDNDTNNFQAFKNAWDSACNSSTPAKILVPHNKTYFIEHINFTGPCQSSISMEIDGTIKAFPEMYDFPKKLWIKFEQVSNLDVHGDGTVDGNGAVWWANSCKIKKSKPCQAQRAPTALTFENCTELKVSSITIMDPQQMHMNIQDSDDVEVSDLTLEAPGHSPNTDGIHLTRASNVKIHDCIIGTGDDCVSIVSGTNNVEVSNIMCGPGHGISIGSLGYDNSEDYVSNIYVRGLVLNGTTNGARIKTWQGGSGYAMNVVFEKIKMVNVSNPIIINQNYCDKNKNCHEQNSAVQVGNIVYRDISGTSATEAAITFNCSDSVPCTNILLENVMLTGQNGAKVQAVCNNLNQTLESNTSPVC